MKKTILSAFILLVLLACKAEDKKINMKKDELKSNEIAVFGAGCFWCVEAVFENLKGVYKVEAGYTGGHIKNPTYKEVSSGTTGHVEVARITFNPKEITFDMLLDVFFKTHDPTTLNSQGVDRGTQYRSAVFYTSDIQKDMARKKIEQLNHEHIFEDTIVTEISKLEDFYIAEDYHQNYFANNPDKGYCVYVIKPKINKFKKEFKDYLK